MGASDQRHAPAALYPRGQDPRYPLDRKLGGLQLLWTQRLEEQFFASAVDRTAVVQSAIRYYTDWANPAPNINALTVVSLYVIKSKPNTTFLLLAWKVNECIQND
jgi:hypothetical protein